MRLRFLTFFSDWLNSKEWLFPRSNGTFEVLLIVRGTELCYHQCDYAISRISKLLNSTRFPELIFESFLCLFIFFFHSYNHGKYYTAGQLGSAKVAVRIKVVASL